MRHDNIRWRAAASSTPLWPVPGAVRARGRIPDRCRAAQRAVLGRACASAATSTASTWPRRVPHVLDYRGRAGGRRPHAGPAGELCAWSASFRRRASRSTRRRRPFVVVDPRAGHGPGIGGFKADSEIGVALKAGHPCYFIGFLPDPMPGQTIEDIARAEAVFLEKVIALHPEADGKPCVIGNCQAGWAVMMLAAMRPELFGPIIVAGSPLSYWAGVHGKNPMRYSRRPARRQLADGAHQRSRRRQVRRRLAGAEFREPQSGEHAVEQAVQSLFQDRHRGAALSRASSAGGAATSI